MANFVAAGPSKPHSWDENRENAIESQWGRASRAKPPPDFAAPGASQAARMRTRPPGGAARYHVPRDPGQG